MITRILTPALAATLLLAGCDFRPPGIEINPSISDSVANGNSELRLDVQVDSGGLSTLAVLNPYLRKDIHHVVVKLFKVDSETETSVLDAQGNAIAQSVPLNKLDAPIIFNRLRAHTTYRIRSYAYREASESPETLISVTNAGSHVDVTLTDDDRPNLATLKVKLIDKLFNGQATASGIFVEDGKLVTEGNESMTAILD